jgi:nitric-oxide synthase, brain
MMFAVAAIWGLMRVCFRIGTSKSFIKVNSQVDTAHSTEKKTLDRLDSLRGSVSDVMSEDNFGPLNNVR